MCGAALVASGLTLFSGFGLGTLLLPAFAIFFPPAVAVAMTAVVHLFNNLFKLGLVGRLANWRVVARFGLPAMAASFLGAWALVRAADLPKVASYELAGASHDISPVGLLVGVVILLFAFLEMAPKFQKKAFDMRYLPLGGVLSGFFGGLSGHQGALRSAFLVKSGLDKQAYVATSVAIACMVDISRLVMYGRGLGHGVAGSSRAVMITAVVAAFAGAMIGVRLLPRVSLRVVHTIVSIMLVVVAIGMGAGLL